MKINFNLRKRTELEYQTDETDQIIAGRADDLGVVLSNSGFSNSLRL
jgi:hypothetical protein